MKISQLLSYLEAIQERYGDLDVVAYKNQQYLDDVEKLVMIEAFPHTGALPPKTTSPEERKLYKQDPHMQPNAGWIPLDMSGVQREQIADKLERKLFLGPKVTVY